jgi:TolA-binding protein
MKRYGIHILLVLICTFFFCGCVYYNTLYNAEKLFKSAQSRPLTNGKPNSQAIDEYTKSMKKCGYILTEYKNSRHADQALFLLAKCLYYKGNSNLQAYEKCQDFLKFYPKDKSVPEVILFESVILHDMKKNEEAVSTLTDFLQEPTYKKYYPRAYLQLSIISMDEKAYAQAQYFLQKIIDNYPHSPAYKKAFFQLGYAYHLESKYTQSNQVFQELLKSRLEKLIKLDARYYIALNDYYLKNNQKVDTEIKPLLHAETRADKIPLIQLLKARNLLGLNQYPVAVSLYETIIKDNPKTLFSAEANYYLGEFYLKYQHDYDKAITYYNNVKNESIFSPFVDDAFSKSAIASQIILYNKKDSNLETREMVNQQMKLAEYYLHSMNLPDSALSVYRGIVKQRERIKTQLDSLGLRIAYLDSLGILKDALNVSRPDSLLKDNITAIKATEQVTDSTKIPVRDVPLPKNQPLSQDSTQAKLQNKTIPGDSVSINISTSKDSLAVEQNKQSNISTIRSLLTKENQLKVNLMEYDNEYTPLALYDQVWIYKYSLPDSAKMGQVYQEMMDRYPLNQYTHAATMMLLGKAVEVTTDEEVIIEEKYTHALDLYSSSPDSAKTILKSIANFQKSPFYDKAKFTLGYIYWFNEHDSLNAKPYFDDLLKKNRDSDYSKFILQFYNGKSFIFTKELSAFKELEEREKQKREAQKANELKQKEQKKAVIFPQPKSDIPDYVLPPMHKQPGSNVDNKDESDKIEQQPLSPHVNVVDQPQPQSNFRPYDFVLPSPPVKR